MRNSIPFVVFLLKLATAYADGQDSWNNGDARLVSVEDGHYVLSPPKGILQVYYSFNEEEPAKWYTVCYVSVHYLVPKVACKQLNYVGVINSSIQETKIDPAPLMSIECDEDEEHLMRCRIATDKQCPPMTLYCDNTTSPTKNPYNGQVFLNQTAESASSGILMIYINDALLPVCASSLTPDKIYSASSACRQLGYTNAKRFNSISSVNFLNCWEFYSAKTCYNSSLPCFSECFKEPKKSSTHPISIIIICEFKATLNITESAGNEKICNITKDSPIHPHRDAVPDWTIAVIIVLSLLIFFLVITSIIILIMIVRGQCTLPTRCCHEYEQLEENDGNNPPASWGASAGP